MTEHLPNDIDMALSFVESEVEALQELGFDDEDASDAINEFRRIEVLLMKLRRLDGQSNLTARPELTSGTTSDLRQAGRLDV